MLFLRLRMLHLPQSVLIINLMLFLRLRTLHFFQVAVRRLTKDVHIQSWQMC